MKDNITKLMRAALVALFALAAFALPDRGDAQVVTQLPVYVDSNGGVYDFGNGPLEFMLLGGSGGLFTSSGSGVGSTSGSSTALTLTATPTTAPCVGCIISGTGITSGTTVSAFNGTTSITLSSAMTVATSTAVAWGAACPTSGAGQKQVLLQPGQPPNQTGFPFYTQARICGVSAFAAGLTLLPFAIGAH